MDKIGEAAEQAASGSGHWFSYVMFAVICYHLYKQFKEKGVLDKIADRIEEIKNK